MRARLALPLLLCVALLLPAGASAAGTRLKGYQVMHPTAVSGMTGSCQCSWQWYTIGLRPGAFHLTLTLRKNGPRLAPTYAVYADLYRGGSTLGEVHVACDSSSSHCNQSATLTRHITTPGIYYLQLTGEGSISIQYSLRLGGSIVPIRCSPRCGLAA